MSELGAGVEFAGHRIDGVAGRGGMGVVYRATDLRLERTVALKVIAPELAHDPEFRSRFERESRLAAGLAHPNVVSVYAAGESEGVLYTTMEFVEGTDLKAMIAARGRIEPGLAATIVAQVASALDAAHGRGLVHRDVKPANVLLRSPVEEPHAYLTDFGLTKLTSDQSGLTATGIVVGTIDYVAPEQLRQDPQLDARTDVYSLGALLFHALSGEVPYPRESDAAKIFAHGSDPPPSLGSLAPGVPPQFDQVIQRAMAKDPDDRFLSAGDLGRAALAAERGQTVSRSERSVATGEAAPTQLHATHVPPLEPAATAPAPARPSEPTLAEPPPTPVSATEGRGRGLWRPAALLAAAVVLAGAGTLVATGLIGGGEDPVDTGAGTEAALGTFEAEDAGLTGGASVTDIYPGYTGTGFVAGFETPGARATFTVDAPSAGEYDVTVRYANARGSDGRVETRTLGVYVNGSRSRTITLPSTLDWETWAEAQIPITLGGGTNTVALEYGGSDSGHVNIDSISLE